MRSTVIRLTCCLMGRACISAVNCPHAVLLHNVNGPVCVRPAVLRVTFCTMVTDLYDRSV